MADYQSSFSGEEIDELLQKVKNDESGTLVQQQADYEENDTSKVTYIKNRPFYTEDEIKHTVVWKDENIDYYNYKVGDIIPRKDGLNELSVLMQVYAAGLDETAVISDEFAVETQYGEDVVMSIGLFSSGTQLQMIFAYSDVLDEDGSVLKPPGIYADFSDTNDAIIDPSDWNVEFTYTFHKQIEVRYIPNSTSTVVFDLDIIGENIAVTSMEDAAKIYLSLYSPTEIRLYLRMGTDGEFIYFPMRTLGAGLYECTILTTTYIYSVDMNTAELVCVGSRPLVPETSTEPTATTYGLRQPSLADQITASLEERGLTKSRLKELFPTFDWSKFLDNEVTE